MIRLIYVRDSTPCFGSICRGKFHAERDSEAEGIEGIMHSTELSHEIHHLNALIGQNNICLEIFNVYFPVFFGSMGVILS